MNKILNWTFGSLFRTIGRLFGFLIVCLLLLIIGSKLGFKLPDFLMPLHVYADEVEYTFSTNHSIICVDKAGTQTCTSWTTNPYDANPTYPVELIKYRVKLSEGWSKDNVYTINVGFKPTPDAISVSSLNVCWQESGVCELYTSKEGWYLNNLGYYRNIFSFSPTTDHPSDEYLYIYVRFNPGYLTTIRPSLNNNLSVSRGTDAIIKDQTNQIIQGQEDLKNEITNDNVSGAQDSAGGFFDDFQSEDFGLSSIVTAPLRGINAMLTDTCVAPSATYKGQQFSLPCGSMLWNRPGGTDFRNFINIMYGGFLAYLVIRKFFLDVEDLKNPDSDKVEVDKL